MMRPGLRPTLARIGAGAGRILAPRRRRDGRREEAAIRRCGLFDWEFYRARHGLGVADEAQALNDFLAGGAASGRRPHPLFDPAFYVGNLGPRSPGARNPLSHYLRRGSRDGRRPNAYFDPAFYRATNPDIALLGFEPLEHYASRGWRELRATSAEFDPLAYRQAHPRLDAAVDPLAELLRRVEAGACIAPGEFGRAASRTPREPSRAEWSTVDLRPSCGAAVDVIMPVYAGRAETLRAIHAVLAARNRVAFELIVVDDASPDRDIREALAGLAQRGLLTLLVNDRNRGFVASCNRAMAEHPERDVVLLNADTEVYGDWLDRLRTKACAAPRTGTATPWTNAGTIMSYPITLRDNHAPLEIDGAGLDAIAAGLDGPPVELPTAVGFCMYMRRQCLGDVGPLDEAHFGRGYGEENDFCRRALKRGWRHVAATNVYVHHYAGRSFGAEREARMRMAVATVERLHPGYLGDVHDFIKRDPLARWRRCLDEARIRAAAPAAVLPGGAVTHARNAAAPQRGIRLVPDVGPRFGLLRLECDWVPIAPNLPPIDPIVFAPRGAAPYRSPCVAPGGRIDVGRPLPLATQDRSFPRVD